MAVAPILLSADTVLPSLVTGLETYLPAAMTSRIAAGGVELDLPDDYRLDDSLEQSVYAHPVCVVRPTPTLEERREWATPQRDIAIACQVVVIVQAETALEAAAWALAWQRMIDVALTRMDRAEVIDGVWRIDVNTPLNNQIGDNKYRRAVGHEVALWTRVTREET